MEKMNYFDCHADTLTEIKDGESLSHNSCNLDLNRVNRFAEQYIQVFALWRDRCQMDERYPEEEFMRLYQRANTLLQKEQESIVLCKNKMKIKQTLAAGKSAALLAVEDVSIMGNHVDRLQELGIAIVMLTWNYKNKYGTGAVSGQQYGLTEDGRRLVQKLSKTDAIMDISHLSDAGIEDALSYTDKPVIASHSNVREVCNHPRNLQTSQIQEIIKRRGIIGMNYYEPFVEKGTTDGLTALFRHMDAILNLGGEDALVLGSDFDGCSNRFVKGITGVESVPYLMQEMKRAGFDEKMISKIFWENGYQFLVSDFIEC